MELYQYQAFDLDQPQFRLLRLHKGELIDPIKGEMFHAFLDTDAVITYEALSYTWGATHRPKPIIVDGKHLFVTESLYEALLHMRLSSQGRFLWIDAICINQENLEERSQQVQQMGSIYTLADRVLIWLGPITDEIRTFMKFASEYCHNWIQQGGSYSTLLDERREQMQLHSYWSVESAGLNALLARSWFERVWILQEVANAKSAIICCGSETMSTSAFIVSPRLLGILPEQHCQAVLDIMPSPLRKASWWNGQRDLYTLLTKFRASKATDDRDKVYAILGMSSDLNVHNIHPDYTKSVQKVMSLVASYIYPGLHRLSSITTYQRSSMDSFLNDFSYISRAYLEASLPSCNPDWLSRFLKQHDMGLEPDPNIVAVAMENLQFRDEILYILREFRTSQDAVQLRELVGERKINYILNSMEPFYEAMNVYTKNQRGSTGPSCKNFKVVEDFEYWLNCNDIPYSKENVSPNIVEVHCSNPEGSPVGESEQLGHDSLEKWVFNRTS